MRTRRALAILAITAAMAATGACTATGSSGGGNAGGGSKVTLSVWSWRPEDASTYKKIFDKFHAAHPNITVDFKPYKSTEYNTILSTGLTQAGGPDVAQLRSYGGLQPLIEAGNLVPLDGKVAGLSNFETTALDGTRGKKDGKVYGVPLEMSTFQIYYNKDIFSKYSLQPPTTWDQLISDSQALLSHGITPFAAAGKDTWLLPLYDDAFAATRYGGTAFEKKVLAGQAKFTDPDYVAALNVLNQLKPYFPKDQMGLAETDVQTLFATGKAAMIPEGSFALAPMKAINANLNLGVFNAPPAPGALVNNPLEVGWVDASYGLNAKSTHQKEALELLQWMTTADFGHMVADDLKQVSLVKGVQSADPLLSQMVQDYTQSPTPYLMLVDFRYGTPLGSDLQAAGLQKMLLGQQSAAQVAGDIQNGIAQWFKP
ncbi:ABC transporter substrate-binding protein [Rugosimonospora africana]|uniref:Sugar ABC transporter substrate-binding protein n=1 Tax=Rugosimonospora africana TaxID=556532 RepID=A0A8J3QXY9_9ACTN|nr:extracellular solute-binding protein [Rugosimonospora africana]GIH17840.1 sugar ABC transporter substrate-binding protein [Rugosimonospora africana]